MKKLLCGVVVACFTASAMPVSASELTAAVASDARAGEGLRRSIERAVQTSSISPSASPQVRLSRTAPRPDRGADRSRKQMGGGGGSKTGMIIGLVSAAAGAAATVYMVKAMKDSTDKANNQ